MIRSERDYSASDRTFVAIENSGANKLLYELW